MVRKFLTVLGPAGAVAFVLAHQARPQPIPTLDRAPTWTGARPRGSPSAQAILAQQWKLYVNKELAFGVAHAQNWMIDEYRHGVIFSSKELEVSFVVNVSEGAVPNLDDLKRFYQRQSIAFRDYTHYGARALWDAHNTVTIPSSHRIYRLWLERLGDPSREARQRFELFVGTFRFLEPQK